MLICRKLGRDLEENWKKVSIFLDPCRSVNRPHIAVDQSVRQGSGSVVGLGGGTSTRVPIYGQHSLLAMVCSWCRYTGGTPTQYIECTAWVLTMCVCVFGLFILTSTLINHFILTSPLTIHFIFTSSLNIHFTHCLSLTVPH